MEDIALVNLILCVVIVIFGCLGFKKANNVWPLYVAIAFGLFGVSHLLTLLGLAATLAGVIIAIRIIGYLLVIYTVYRAAFKTS